MTAPVAKYVAPSRSVVLRSYYRPRSSVLIRKRRFLSVLSPMQHLNSVSDPNDAALLIHEDLWNFIPDPSDGGRGDGIVIRDGGSGIPSVTSNKKKKPKCIWNTPDDILPGTALGGTQLNAVFKDPVSNATLAGTKTYTPDSGFVLMPGKHQKLIVKFAPTDTGTYQSAGATVYINVGKLTPMINWPDPDPIASGSAIGPTQLDAVALDPVTMATVAGVFTYTPASGTVLPDGSNALSVSFAPTNTTKYVTPVTATVNIEVGSFITFLQWDFGNSVLTPPSVDLVAEHGQLILAFCTITNNVAGNHNLSVASVTDDSGNVYSRLSAGIHYDVQFNPTEPLVNVELWAAVATKDQAVTVTMTQTTAYPNVRGEVCGMVFAGTHPTTPIQTSSYREVGQSAYPFTLTTHLSTSSMPVPQGGAAIGFFVEQNASTLNIPVPSSGFSVLRAPDGTNPTLSVTQSLYNAVVASRLQAQNVSVSGTDPVGATYQVIGVTLKPL